jgi:integrase/recombinase XerD
MGLMSYLGLRVAEAVAIRIEHINLDDGSLLVADGKNHKDDYLGIPDFFLPEITSYVGKRRYGWLFPSPWTRKRAGHLTTTTLWYAVKRAAAAAGFQRSIHPHTLRHSFGTALVRAGLPLTDIQALMRHEDLASTLLYLRLDTSHLKEAINKLPRPTGQGRLWSVR